MQEHLLQFTKICLETICLSNVWVVIHRMPMKVLIQQFENYYKSIWVLGSKIIEISAYLAVGIFNEGYNSALQIMSKLNWTIDPYDKVFDESTDEAWESNRTVSAFVKQKLLIQPENSNKLKKINFLKSLRVYYMHLGLLMIYHW